MPRSFAAIDTMPVAITSAKYALERPPRRSGHRNSGRDLERAVVAGAMEASAGEIGHDRAAQVRALLVVGDVLPRAGAEDDAGVVRLGVMEDERAADRDRL